MRIKQIIIENFQSYKYEVLDDTSDRINLVLGQNGHGKSNIINAVCFVITDKYPLTRDEERKALINNNANPLIDNISVEIKFDNSERKVPDTSGNNELSLKRIVNAENRSEHRFNDRAITKHELENILSCCGLSMNNPYNIIQQGRINKIANMSEKDMYNLLQEIIGTNSFETKKNEALKTFDQIAKEKVKVEEMLEEIKNHIEELNTEKELYKDYETTEVEATCIEFCIYQKHLTDIQKKLDNFTTQYNDLLKDYTTEKNDEIDQATKKTELRNLLDSLKHKDQSILNKETILIDDLRDLRSKAEKIKIQLANIETTKASLSQAALGSQEEPEKAQARMDELEGKLKRAITDLQRREAELHQARGQLREYTRQLDGLLLNKGASQNFKNVQQKKDYYTQQVQKFEEKVKKSKEQIRECQQSIDKNRNTMNTNKDRLQVLATEIKKNTTDLDQTTASISGANQKKTEIASQMKNLIYTINQDKSDHEELKKNAGKLQRTLQQSLKDNLLYTIETIMDKVKERGIQGVYGQLIDLIKIKPELNVCCDIVLKNKLFGFVVDSYETADLLIKINQEIKGSAINIYPMSWIADLRPQDIEYPTGNDVIIVKNHVQAQEGLPIDIRPLIENIFGKTLLVRNYQTATVIAKKYKLNCVTSEGELVYAGSYLTKLGFYDVREESITMYLQYKGIKDNLDQTKVTIGKSEQEKDNLSNEDLQLTQRLHQLVMQKNTLTQNLMGGKAELKYLVNENLILEKIIKDNEGYIKLYEDEILGFHNKIDIYNQERDNPNLNVEGTLRDDEKTLLDQITSQVNTLKEQIRKGDAELIDLRQSYKEYHEDYEKTKASLQGPQPQVNVETETEIFTKELKTIENQVYNMNEAIKRTKQSRQEVLEEMDKATDELKETEAKHKTVLESKLALEEELAKVNTGKAAYLEAKEVYSRKLNQMDHVKSDMVSQYNSKTIKELLTRLENLRRERKKFTAKDKVLFERLDNLNNKYEQFTAKIEELEKNEEDAQKLIDTFDSNIQDKIAKIFKTFSKNLEKYFSKITNGGKITAKLLKERAKSRRDAEGQKYVAISLNISFARDEDDEDEENQPENMIRASSGERGWSSMSSLSAGQKTVVAIAFIFGLQRCDPAPFYFLDEFDAALDPHYRQNIAQIIHENSALSQYFITTFKGELLEIPNAAFFEVKYEGNVSRIAHTDVNRAKEILALNEDEEKRDQEMDESRQGQ